MHDGQENHTTLLNGYHGTLTHNFRVGHLLNKAVKQLPTQPCQLTKPRVTSHLVQNFNNVIRALQCRVSELTWVHSTPLAVESGSSREVNARVHAMTAT